MLAAVVEGRQRATEKREKELAWLAHTTAALGRVKKFPKLADLTPKRRQKKKRKEPAPWEAMLAAARSWDAVVNRGSRP